MDSADAIPTSPPEDLPPTPEVGDNLVGAKVVLPIEGEQRQGRVRRRKRGRDGQPIGRSNPNPILDSREYEVEFDDGQVSHVTANLIAQSLYE